MAHQTIQTFAQCEVKAVSVKAIKPYGRNPRRNDNAVDAVAKSIELFGFRQPIVCDLQGVIVVGHTRYKAALKLGLETVPVVYADLTPEQAKAYRLADNKTGELAMWDYEALQTQLDELSKNGLDVLSLGFTEHELGIFDENDPENEWRGMPEFEQEDKSGYQSIKLHFADEAAVEEFNKLTGCKILPKTKYAWYPPIEPTKIKGVMVVEGTA